ncbi:BglG family transcription antiterminator LicT [Anaerosinus massiliensis]|uniref:BglG family transcription antiterminator LicT n=1 Tax=Massilibacillus massiliensis TaxID=1806837 RepID=UPI000AECD4BD|nr:PRD domain-containing protein [Massilibacillus massiliensis]
MKIEEVLNNNAVVCLNEKLQEYVVVGRGIAFRLKNGDSLPDANKVQKIFTFSNTDAVARFKQVAKEIALEYILLSAKIIDYAKETYAKKLDDRIYVTLTEHIYRVIGRESYGFQLKNAMRWEIRHIYKEEFMIGKKALAIIERQCNIELKEDEAAFIALHFVNAELNGDLDNIVDVTKVIQGILATVKNHFKIEYDDESINYSRFITHLKFLAQRLFSGKIYPDKDDEMFDTMSEKYVDTYECVKKIKAMISEEYEYELTKEEQMYLIIHIEKVIR